MNKVITINLNGTAFQLEDAGYDALREYLERARGKLGANPDRDEILSDIERAIADKFRGRLSAHKNVVLVTEVREVLDQMGEIQDESGASESDSKANTAGGPDPRSATQGMPRRLYRIREGAQLAGVCNGLAAYVGIDATIIRLAFIALSVAWGAGVLVYIVMAVVIPEASSPEEKAHATGAPFTAQEFIRRAREGYYQAMRSFPDKTARREWRRQMRRHWSRTARHEWHAQNEAWRQQWHAAHPGAGLALPFISLLHGALVMVWVCALISLLATGELFGLALPLGLPVWGAVLILLIAHGMLVWPLKAARRAFYFGLSGGPHPASSLFILLDVLVWIAVIAFVVWLARDNVDYARDAIQNVPTVFHDGIDAIRDWWNRK